MAGKTSSSRRMFMMLDWWRLSMVDMVRKDIPDLTSRQMSLLLTVYMTGAPHTVKGLSEMLGISKPAVTRAVDKLEKLGLLKRKTDETDKRIVQMQRTVKGSVFLSDISDLINNAATITIDQKAA